MVKFDFEIWHFADLQSWSPYELKKSLAKLIKIAERIPADLLKTHMAVTYTVQ